jgi:hypothetical protein
MRLPLVEEIPQKLEKVVSTTSGIVNAEWDSDVCNNGRYLGGT